MSTTVTRLYERHEQALAAAGELASTGFAEDAIRVITAGSASAGEIASTLEDAGFSSGGAADLAARIAGGAALVVLRAPFGTAVEAMELMDRHGPVASSEAVPDRTAEISANARLSLGAWIPVLISSKSSTVLLKGDSTTRLLSGRSATKLSSWSLSRKLGLPELSSGRTMSAKFGIPELSSSSRRGR